MLDKILYIEYHEAVKDGEDNAAGVFLFKS